MPQEKNSGARRGQTEGNAPRVQKLHTPPPPSLYTYNFWISQGATARARLRNFASTRPLINRLNLSICELPAPRLVNSRLTPTILGSHLPSLSQLVERNCSNTNCLFNKLNRKKNDVYARTLNQKYTSGGGGEYGEYISRPREKLNKRSVA